MKWAVGWDIKGEFLCMFVCRSVGAYGSWKVTYEQKAKKYKASVSKVPKSCLYWNITYYSDFFMSGRLENTKLMYVSHVRSLCWNIIYSCDFLVAEGWKIQNKCTYITLVCSLYVTLPFLIKLFTKTTYLPIHHQLHYYNVKYNECECVWRKK